MSPKHFAIALLLSLVPLAASAAITGTVVNGDGQAIAGARVSIFAPEPELARRERLVSASPERVPIASVQTDAKGNFAVPSPKESVVTIAMSARGFGPQQFAIERDEELGAVVLPRAETRTASVTASGKPVAGATVSVRYGAFEWTVRTDEKGHADVPDPRDASSILVFHPDYAIDAETFMRTGKVPASELNRTLTAGTARSGTIYESDGKTPAPKATIYADGWPVATTGEDGTFQIAHFPREWSMLMAKKGASFAQRAYQAKGNLTMRLAKGGSISGKVIDSKTRLPVASVLVSARPRRFGRGDDFWADALTDAKGTWSIQLPAGTYATAAAHPGYASQSWDANLAAGEPSSRDVAVNPLARVSGIVVDEGRHPVGSATVRLDQGGSWGPTGPRFIRDVDPVTTTPDGRFTLKLPAERDARLRASKKAFPTASSEPLRLNPGERKTGVVITMPSGIEVTGRVVDASGNPLPGVSVVPSEGEQGGRARMMIVMGRMGLRDDDTVLTGSDGRFSMRVKEGTWNFGFRLDGYAAYVVRAQKIAAGEKNEVEATLTPAVEISGRVVRGASPVAGVEVWAMGGEDEASTVSGPDGTFVLGGLSEGSTMVTFMKPDDLVQEMKTLRAPSRDVVIELQEGETISGRVLEKGSRQPVTSFQVGISMSRGGGGMIRMGPPLLRAFTSDDGSFVLEHVPTGAINLVANAPGFTAGKMNLHVDEGKEIEGLEMELEHGVRLFGKVTASNGSPVADATVRLAQSAGPATMGPGERAVTDANGDYSLDSLEPGERSVEVAHDTLGTARKTATLKGRETRLDIQLDAGVRLTGTVVSDSGAAVADADVTVTGGGRWSMKSGPDGSFELEGVRPGRYAVYASKTGFAEGKVEDFDVSAGAPVRIVLKTGGSIFGRVTGLDSRDFPQVMVRATVGDAYLSSAVDPSGNYRLEGVPAGTAQVAAYTSSRSLGGGRSSRSQTVEMTAGGSRQLDIEFNDDIVIQGRVTRNGTPMAGAMVGFSPKTAGTQTYSSTSTNDQGEYSLTGLSEGEYNVVVVDLQRFSPYNTTTSVRGSATFDIDFTANALRGRVVEASSNDPIDGATVDIRSTSQLESSRNSRSAASDSGGAFALDFVAPGTYLMTVTKDGYGNEVREIQVGDSSEDLEVRLSRSDGVTFRILDARDGRTLRGYVTVLDAMDRIIFDSRTAFSLGPGVGPDELKVPLSPGSYRAAVSAGGYATRMVSFNSPGIQTVGLTPGGTLLIESKQPTRRRIQLLDSNGGRYYHWISRTGRFDLLPDPGVTTLQNIAAGSYTVQLLSEDETTVVGSVIVTVPEGGVAKTEL